MELNDLETICKKLHHINFNSNDGIVRPINARENASEYRFNKNLTGSRRDGKEWIKRCHEYPSGQCYCTKCNGLKLLAGENIDSNNNYRFTAITHGAHTLDFLDAHNKDRGFLSGWSKKPVLFLFENPGSINSANYGDGVDSPTKLPNIGDRLPCKWWYWINGQDDERYKNEDFAYPNWFTQKEYGWMVYSVINTFKIANAYATNMVKCGIGSSLKDYVTTDAYNEEIVDTCLELLKKEIAALRGESNETVTVFAFGERVYKTALKHKECFTDCNIHLLPHPANRLANDYRKYVLIGKIMQGLLAVDFYSGVEPVTLEQVLLLKTNSEEFFVPTKDKVLEILNRYVEDKAFSENNGYLIDKYTYRVCDEKDGVQVIFRHKERSAEGKDYRVSWACYYAETGEIYLYKGEDAKSTSANLFVESGHEKYGVYKQLEAFVDYLVKELKKENPKIKLKEVVTVTKKESI